MSITTIGHHVVHYEALGRGEPLIFIHGWFGSWRYWWSAMQALSSHYRSFALDLWGFGDSTKDSDSYNLAAYAALLDGFVERLGIALPVTLVGHSLGAAVALRYAASKPEAVRRVAAVALPIRGQLMHPRLLDGEPGTILNRVLRATFADVESELRKTDVAALNRLAAELYDSDFAAELAAPPVPVLLVYGESDPVVQMPNGSLTEPATNRAFVNLDTSHFPMLEEPAKFNRLIHEFIRAGDDLSDVVPKDFWQRRVH